MCWVVPPAQAKCLPPWAAQPRQEQLLDILICLVKEGPQVAPVPSDRWQGNQAQEGRQGLLGGGLIDRA